MLKPIILAISLAAMPVAASADPNPQLVASIQSGLNRLGFQDVDASRLSTRQVVALKFALDGRSFGGVGLTNAYFAKRSRVQTILRWGDQNQPSN